MSTKGVSVFILTSVLVWVIVQTSPVSSYITSIKEGYSISSFSYGGEDPIVSKIRDDAKSKSENPVNAYLDPVFKAIPGYNGVEVDLKSTIKKSITAKENSSSDIRWVYKEIKPSKNLGDLEGYPIYRGNKRKNAASIMVNVSWGSEYIKPLLEIFKKEKVKATFFIDGSWLTKNKQLGKSILAQGHEIGNHAYSHPLMSKVTKDRMEKEISKTEDVIFKALGVHSKWFAPPAGDFNNKVIEVAEKSGLKTVLWTADTIDWRDSSTPDLMVSRIQKKIGPGVLILTHPTERTVKAMPSIIKVIKDKKLKLMNVSDTLSTKRIDL